MGRSRVLAVLTQSGTSPGRNAEDLRSAARLGPVLQVILYAGVDLNETLTAGRLLDLTGHYARPEVLGLRFNLEPYTAAA